ncbi:phytoene desaturase family protein [Spirosoma utsteinense]|uniref:Phytoene dehydrogenase-like protein n=1 Tax=Spirosoma utsteinense TaxID=2585773 RepID=A0ABR6W8E9_9BACT|nr:NAD(P)/FAD-dependent oxidoreductase [Spirosoma utsteinense]MBC3787549.1 phytoene dehydrogenase-like protein [Spirosoma utsteinense]MBC3792236.1 phytoene dehydrogenase-like protein [Spirosoma utsteinense]
MTKPDYDAVVVGSGPNGLSAAIVLQHAGLSVLVLEAKPTIGGGTRSAELTLPGFVHDIGSAIHPLAAGSPFFQSLPLDQHGLHFIYPPTAAAHPFDNGTAAVLRGSVADTAQGLGVDGQAYRDLFDATVRHWPTMAADILGPLRFPDHPVDMGRFGLDALLPVTQLAKRFKTTEARGLLAGMAAHAIQPLTNLTTAAVALVLMTAGHLRGWPMPRGGSQAVADALASYFSSLGGQIETSHLVESMADIPSSKVVLFDLSPKQLLSIVGNRFPALYRKQLAHYRYGMGVFKIDWALDGPIPFTAAECHAAGTIHLGGTLEQITAAEQATANGQHPDRPYVLLAQQSLFDPSRAPAGKHTAWAYCHVPNGSTVDRTDAIEQQVERVAPGFRDRIIGRHTMNTAQVEAWNPNYIGGDINGGIIDIGQLFTRPTLRLTPYRTGASGIYICSSSTPPGGGVHGMCGYHAALIALRDGFGLNPTIQLANG